MIRLKKTVRRPGRPLTSPKRPFLALCAMVAAFGATPAWPQGDGLAPGAPVEEIRAQVVPRRFTTLSSDTAGRIEKISVRESERFTADQVLIGMDCALQRAQLEEAKAVLTGARKSAEVNKRMLQLNSGGVLEAELAAVEVTKDEAKLQAAQVLVSKCTIAAPYQGRVAEQRVREQQYVQAGQPVLDIVDDSVLEVEFIVPSAWLTWLRPGEPFTLTVDESGKSYAGVVSLIGARVDAVSHSIKITGTLDGESSGLTAGMSGLIHITRTE